MSNYYNPVKVIKTDSWADECINAQKFLGIQNPLIVTSKGTFKRNNLFSVFSSTSMFCDIKPDPTFESCQNAIEFSNSSKFDGVIAIGGGSVMDTGKAVLASIGTGICNFIDLLIVTKPYVYKVPSIFIPTTHGTGSEVTMWGTIWNTEEKKKYSISHPDLYPNVAILDGNITSKLPLDISVTTALDALSHSFEAIWNKNANPKSTNYAIEAICLILTNIEKLKSDPHNIGLRNILLKAANLAGLAFSNTKTAAAHSISYPLTSHYGIPHGIASSLPLIPLLHINKKKIRKELNLIIDKLKISNISELELKINNIPKGVIKYSLSEWGVKKNEVDLIVPECFTKSRMENNIVHLSLSQVRSILYDIY
jgi:alcohol dehydrogenase class IV